jgi:uncharacterized protein (TIGR02217 family)
MAFLEQRLSTRIEQGASGGPTVPGRTKAYTPSGKLRQNFVASAPIHKFDVSHGLRQAADYQTVLDLWYVVMLTPYEGFRFRDWRDYRATTTNSRCTLITGSTYQLQRVHVFGGVEVLRAIYKPVAGVVITRTRSGTPSTATHTLDTTTGIATISGHVAGDTYTWAGEFDLPVTFSSDEWVSTLQAAAPNLLVVNQSIPLEEIRL